MDTLTLQAFLFPVIFESRRRVDQVGQIRSAKVLSERPKEDVANMPRYVCKCGWGRALPIQSPGVHSCPKDFLFFFGLFEAAPTAYGGSQARG